MATTIITTAIVATFKANKEVLFKIKHIKFINKNIGKKPIFFI